MKLSGINKPGSFLLLERNFSEAVPLFAQRYLPVYPAHSSPGLKTWGFLRRRINIAELFKGVKKDFRAGQLKLENHQIYCKKGNSRFNHELAFNLFHQ